MQTCKNIWRCNFFFVAHWFTQDTWCSSVARIRPLQSPLVVPGSAVDRVEEGLHVVKS